jgi:hypothetical protein
MTIGTRFFFEFLETCSRSNNTQVMKMAADRLGDLIKLKDALHE